MTETKKLSDSDISAIVHMALSDDVPFATIEMEYGLSESEVKTLMRSELKSGSYRAWRKRIRDFGDRRKHYK